MSQNIRKECLVSIACALLLWFSKSIASALIGIAIEQGKTNGVQTKLLDFFQEHENLENMDSRKEEITLEQVLTMTTGFQWIEFDYSNPDNDVDKMARSPDWVRYVLDLPMSQSPRGFVYNSGVSVLLSGILKNSTGQSAEEFAIDHLFGPLGIERWSWSIGPNEITNTGFGLALRRLDMARIGALFLNDGRWGKNQVVPTLPFWISLIDHGEFGDRPPVFSNVRFGCAPC